MVIMGTMANGDYAGGGLSFEQCVNTTTWTGVKFTLGGTTGGCTVQFQLQTSTQKRGSGGACSSDPTASCFNFPKKTVDVGSPQTVLWTDLENTGLPADAAGMAAEIVGLQWQFVSPAAGDGGAAADCTGINLTIDDVSFAGP
jgi:hypothetical protein